MPDPRDDQPPSPPQTPSRVPLAELPCFPWDLFTNLVEPVTKDLETLNDMLEWSDDKFQEARDDANDLRELAVVQIADATLREGVKDVLLAFQDMVERVVAAQQRMWLLERQKEVVKQRMQGCMRRLGERGGPKVN